MPMTAPPVLAAPSQPVMPTTTPRVMSTTTPAAMPTKVGVHDLPLGCKQSRSLSTIALERRPFRLAV
jgi:hypothetical protein